MIQNAVMAFGCRFCQFRNKVIDDILRVETEISQAVILPVVKFTATLSISLKKVLAFTSKSKTTPIASASYH